MSESGYNSATGIINPKFWIFFYKLWQKNLKICVDAISEVPEITQMIEEKSKFDLVVVCKGCAGFGICGSYLAHLLDAKIINFSSAKSHYLLTSSTGKALRGFYLFLHIGVTMLDRVPLLFLTAVHSLNSLRFSL